MEEDPKTGELKVEQLQREKLEREAEEEAPTDPGTDTARRRADKAAYLHEQLEKRAQAEREADE